MGPPTGRGRWGRAYCARNRRGASQFWRGDSSASFITWVRGFLTKVHVVSKRLLVVQELKPENGVPSEPCTELIPSFFGFELCAILIVWAICHFRSEGISIVAVVAEDAPRDFGQHQAGRQQVPSCAGQEHVARRSATEPRQHFLLRCSLAQNCRARC